MASSLDSFFGSSSSMIVQQLKEWVEIISHIETRNKYEILSPLGDKIAFAAEDGGGFGRTVLRMWLQTRRPLDIHIVDPTGKQVIELTRPFFFFFSNMAIRGPEATVIGRAKKRFGIIYKKYDLCIGEEEVFARIKAPLWRLWTFQVYDLQGNPIAAITKKWGGVLKEVFTDSDRFEVQFPEQATSEQKAVLLASALSIDLDYFEENAGRSRG